MMGTHFFRITRERMKINSLKLTAFRANSQLKIIVLISLEAAGLDG